MKKSLFKIAVFLMVFTSMAFAQNEVDLIETFTSYNAYDFDFVGGGTRAKGMGNAFIGVSNDVTGGAGNPAGLYELDETTVGVSWFSLSPKGVSTSQSITDLTVLNHSGSFSNLSSFNFVSPIRIQGHPFVFSMNLTRNFNSFAQFGYKQSLPLEFITDIPNVITYYDTNNVDFTQNVRQEGGLNSINFGFGTRFYDNISFGAAINIYTGRSILSVENNSVIDNFRYQVVQFATVTTNSIIEDTNKFSGANFTVGFKYNGDKLDAGLTIRTPFYLKENREQGLYTKTDINGVPQATDTIFNIDILYKYELPLMIGTGVGYQVNENWLLAGDIEYRGFSGKKVNFRTSKTVNPGGNNEEVFQVNDPKWNNSLSIRVGSEYIKSYDFGDIPIRFGYGYVPTPTPSLSVSGTSTTVVNNNFTFGSGIHFDKIHLDLSYVYTTSNFEINTVNGIFDYKNHNINVSFTGVF